MASKLQRFVSQPAHENRAYVPDGKETASTTVQQETQRPRRPNFVSQISVRAQEKVDVSERQVDQVGELLKRPNFQRIFSLREEEPDIEKDPIVIESTITKKDITSSGYATHRDIKPGSQRFRWNLVFNLLLWIIVPLPFWLPFASNKVAIYMIPTIQGIFASIWASKFILLEKVLD